MPERVQTTESVYSYGRVPSARKKKEWNFATLNDLHLAANSLLRHAMLNERSKRWTKVIESYKELLWLIDLDHFPDDYEPPSNYSMLLYELHFHLGVAYQHVGNHIKATEMFSKTIQDVSIAKNGCLAGCLTNSCLMTPVYARRAFASAFQGHYRSSIKDAEQAVVLDSGNAYVYCIRALVRSTFDDEIQGLQDLETALRIDKDHICATMLKASFTKPLVTDDNQQYGFYGKAVRLCQEAETYLTCNNFQHPCILEFYDKFLFPLCVPHTITRINLTPDKPSKKQLEAQSTQTVQEKARPNSAPSYPPGTTANPSTNNNVFRCGTSKITECNRMNLKRRVDYGNAIRQHMGRPQSAQEFFKQLEKQRKRETDIKRAQSAIVRPGERFARSLASQPVADNSPVSNTRPQTVPTNTSDMLNSRRAGEASTVTYENSRSPTSAPFQGFKSPPEDIVQKLIKKKAIQIEAPKNCSIPVFQPVNIRYAPRMYYRPWRGDKLPATERRTIKYSPKFY